MYLISGNITSNVTGNLLVITGNGNIGNITSNFRTLIDLNLTVTLTMTEILILILLVDATCMLYIVIFTLSHFFLHFITVLLGSALQ